VARKQTHGSGDAGEARSQLSKALALIRIGNYAEAEPLVVSELQKLKASRSGGGDELYGTVLFDWRALSDEQLTEQRIIFRTAALAAELADYRGKREAGAQALKPVERVTDHLEDVRDEPLVFHDKRDPRWRLLRQQLFCAWQLAVRDYRAGQPSSARRTLDVAIHIAESMTPSSGGLLTQLYYAQATMRLRDRAFREATLLFRQSLTSASERFSAARADDVHERQAAQYAIGKALALGLAQCLLDQGRLEEAHTVVIAGRMLLELTPDVIHRHYAQQLLGSIERTSARDTDTALLASARSHLADSAKFFGHQKPSAALRARYELGLIDLHLGKADAAERQLRAVLTDAKRVKSHKWQASARIGLSRAARQRGDFASAVAEAGRARTNAIEGELVTVEIEARTALIQALFDQQRGEPERLDEVEREIHELLRKVPEHDARSRVVNLLVLVRVLAAGGHMRRARAKYEEYERIAHLVQSPRIDDEARLALQALSSDGFRCPADRVPPVYNLKENLKEVEEYVISKVRSEFDEPKERAVALQMRPSTYYKHANKK
jgi:hypothetical protein